MLKDCYTFKKVIIATGRTDLRKGIDSLAALVRLNYGLNPLEQGTLFLFCGTKSDRAKGLIFEGDGFILMTIRLSQGCRFQWPRTADEARKLTQQEFRMLMDGYSIISTNKQKS